MERIVGENLSLTIYNDVATAGIPQCSCHAMSRIGKPAELLQNNDLISSLQKASTLQKKKNIIFISLLA